jgi:hypothetical protein
VLNVGTFESNCNNGSNDDDNLSYELHLNFMDAPADTRFSRLSISSSTLLVQCFF